MKTYEVHVEEGEGGYLVATVKGLHGAHTQARTVTQLKRRVAEVIQLCEEMEAERSQAARSSKRPRRRARADRIRGSYVVKVPA